MSAFPSPTGTGASTWAGWGKPVEIAPNKGFTHLTVNDGTTFCTHSVLSLEISYHALNMATAL